MTDGAEIENEFEEVEVPAVSEENDVIEGEELLRQDETDGEVIVSDALGNKKKGKAAQPTKNSAKPIKKATKPAKKSKVMKAALKKKGKTLREDEMELNSLFDEKIVVKADNFFYCKDCPGFVTSARLLARTHAQSCGSKKKQTGRRPKRISCPDCGAFCEGKKGLKKHYKVSHVITSYSCSKCVKTFKNRKNYVRHLKIHDDRTAVKCPFCPRTFLKESYMRRHMKRVHQNAMKPKANTSVRDNVDEDDVGTEVNFEIEVQLEEAKIGQEHSWQLNVSFPASDKARSCSYGSFFNTLGFYSKQDWNDWVKISQILSLPLSAGGHRDEFELAWNRDGKGKEEIICIGTTSKPTLFEGGEVEDVATISDINAGVSAQAGTAADDGAQAGNAGVGSGQTGTAGVDSALAGVDSALDGVDSALAGNDSALAGAGAAEPMDGAGAAEPMDVSGAAHEIDVDGKKNEREIEDNKEEKDVNDGVDGDGAGLKDSKEPLLVICPHCNEGGFKDAWFLKRHVQRMHLVPIKCEICQTVFIDKYRYFNHTKECFFTCPREGCTFREKRKSRLEGHMRKHEREW